MIDITMFIVSPALIVASVWANYQIEQAMNKIAEDCEKGKSKYFHKIFLFRA